MTGTLGADAGGEPPRRMLTFASGGWVLLLSGVVSLALITWAIDGNHPLPDWLQRDIDTLLTPYRPLTG